MKASAGLRRRLLLLVALLSAGLAVLAYETDALKSLELSTIDERFSVRGTQAEHGVVMVAIDEKTIDTLKERWPFRRSHHAKVIDTLQRDGARVIAYDVLFTERTTDAEDNALVEAVDKARPMVLAASKTDKNGHTNVFGGEDTVRAVGARVGSVNYKLDPGGVFRRVPYEVDGLKTFAVATVEAATKQPLRRSDLGGDSALIDFAGPPDTIQTVSFVDVMEHHFKPGTFRGKIVVVGVTDPTIQDVHASSTSGSVLMSGPEIQANAIATVRDHAPLRPIAEVLSVLLTALLAALVPLASLRIRGLGALGLGALAAGAYLLACQLAFNAGHVLPVAYPLAGLALASVIALALYYLFSALDRERVRDTFARFVPETVVSQVLARTDDDLRLGGTRMIATVMFSDIRGFTTFAEKHPPETAIELLNQHLGEMSDAILGHGGTVVAFMGDGIMAVFGAPLEQEDHADRALAAAKEMLSERLPRVNAWVRERGLEDRLRIGIGLNSGPVLSGNIGSARRLEYTAIGDTTNTAARIESQTKVAPFSLLLSEATRQMLSTADDDLVHFEDAEMKGKSTRVRLYGWSAEPTPSRPTAAGTAAPVPAAASTSDSPRSP